MSVEKRGDRWLARVSRMVDGKQKQTSRSFRLKGDADRWHQEQRDKIERGLWVQPSRDSLNTYLDRWLAGPHEARRRTVSDYGRILRTYIRPTLGEVRLDQLSTDAVRVALADLTSQGYAPNTVRAAHRVLRLVLNAAVEDRVLVKNPAVARRMLPPMDRREQRVLTRDEVRRLLDATLDDPFGPLWNVLVLSGGRPSEILGLQWPDLDLVAGVLRIRRALTPQTRDGTGKVWRLEDTKTGKHRAVPLLQETVEALIRHRDRQAVERVIAGEGYRDFGFVFCNALGEPLREDALYKGPFYRALRAAGLPSITLYGLRHTAATLMLEAGIAMKVVQERLGHSTMMLTADTYSHVSATLQERAVQQLDRYIQSATL